MIKLETNNEDKHLVNKEINTQLIITVFFQIVVLIIFISFFYFFTLDYLNRWFVLLLNVSLLFLCLYLWLPLILKMKLIKNKTLYKLQDNFTVIDKKIEKYPENESFDVNYYYLKLISESTKDKKELHVSGNYYRKIKKQQIITITYFEKLNFLLEAKYGETILKDSRFRKKTELNIFKILKKYA